VFCGEKGVSGQATPRRDIFAGAGISRRHLQYLAVFHPAQPRAQLKDEIPARHIAGVPGFSFR
jgi:hypothetical protein